MHSHVICICTCVTVAAEEVVYEVVAEPQESQGQTPQQEDRGELAQGPAHPKPGVSDPMAGLSGPIPVRPVHPTGQTGPTQTRT